MSGVAKLEILCPNGHRMVVNTSHGCKLHQVREECCLKQRLGSPDGFIFKHNRRLLDLSLPVHQLGLTNMAKLELIKAEASTGDTKVRIGLEMTSERTRFQREFDPTTALSEVVQSFEKDDGRGGKLDLSKYSSENLSPVIVYVNEEVLGDYALQSTTLKTLGIFKGSHLLKLSYKSISDERLSEVRQKLDQERGRISRLAAKAAAASEAEEKRIQSQSVSASSGAGASASSVPTGRTEEPMDLSHLAPPPPPVVGRTLDVAQDTMEECSGSYAGNEVVRSSAPGTVSPAAPQNLGFGNDFSAIYGSQDNQQHYWMSSESLQLPQPQFSPFAAFKFPEETKGKDIYRNEFSEVNRNDFLPCDRETVLFSLNEPESEVVYEDDVGDDFFEHTVSDLKVLQASLSREVSSIDDQPLMTQAMRSAFRNAKMSSYQRFIVRFEFPDRLVLQAVFRPAETVASLYKFVKETLDEKNVDFELYTTPPRIVLEDRAQTLIEAELGPLALIHFKARSQTDEANEAGFLSMEVLNSMSLRAKAKDVLGKHLPARKPSSAQGGPDRGGADVPGPSMQVASTSHHGQQSGSSSTAARSSNKVPKWFMPGPK